LQKIDRYTPNNLRMRERKNRVVRTEQRSVRNIAHEFIREVREIDVVDVPHLANAIYF